MDGVPILDDQVDYADWDLVDDDAIGRVEIVPGPIGNLYGSEAMGGVINMITRTPKAPNETSAYASYGSLNSSAYNLFQGGTLGKVSYVVAGRLYHTDGYTVERNPASYNIDRKRDTQNIFSKVVYRPTDDSSLTMGIADAYDFFNKGRTYLTVDRNDTLGYTTYTKKYGDLDLQANFYFLNSRFLQGQDYSGNSYSTDNGLDTAALRTMGGSLQAAYHAERVGDITLGLDNKNNYAADSIITTLKTPRWQESSGRQTFFSPFIRDSMKFLDDELVVDLGGRFDWYENYDGRALDTNPTAGAPFDNVYAANSWQEFNPSAGVVWHADDKLSLRTAAGHSFDAPTPIDLYKSLKDSVSGLNILSNPSLKPETMWSYEVGADWKPVEPLVAKVTVYQWWGQNLITKEQINPTTLQKANVSRVATTGAESELRWQVAKELSTSLSYTYDYAKITSDPNGNVGHDFWTLRATSSRGVWTMTTPSFSPSIPGSITRTLCSPIPETRWNRTPTGRRMSAYPRRSASWRRGCRSRICSTGATISST